MFISFLKFFFYWIEVSSFASFIAKDRLVELCEWMPSLWQRMKFQINKQTNSNQESQVLQPFLLSFWNYNLLIRSKLNFLATKVIFILGKSYLKSLREEFVSVILLFYLDLGTFIIYLLHMFLMFSFNHCIH